MEVAKIPDKIIKKTAERAGVNNFEKLFFFFFIY
jgi:hypothetical protein